MANNAKFVRKVVEDGRRILTDALDNLEINYPCIGIEYFSWSWKKILKNFEQIQKYAAANNLSVRKASDGSQCLFFEYSGIRHV